MHTSSKLPLTLQMLQDAREKVKNSPLHVVRTPVVNINQTALLHHPSCDLFLKLENLQTTGSFKIRGVANQFAGRPRGGQFVTMSAGNYGKAFAYALKEYSSKGKVVMPETAPSSRAAIIASYGADVERVPQESLQLAVDNNVREHNMTFLHSFDDVDLMAGHGSLGFEILEDVPNLDVIVISCGGGGLLAGVSAAVKLQCPNVRIYGVEPEGACTMFRSFAEGKAVSMSVKTIAAGLAPPCAGSICYNICKEHVEDIVLVSDNDIRVAVSVLYNIGLVVEPSGAAGFAAVLGNKIPDVSNKRVVVVISGRNISLEELHDYPIGHNSNMLDYWVANMA
ncbi:serine racemase isoform X2 [Protopterus annectens]|nr:serine racemase isoform X2 [Protopterus annectens]